MAFTFEQASQTIIKYLQKGDDSIKIPEDVNLFESNLLDSLQFMGFILLLEEVTGAAIDVAEVDVLDFSTFGRIKEKFLAPLQSCVAA